MPLANFSSQVAQIFKPELEKGISLQTIIVCAFSKVISATIKACICALKITVKQQPAAALLS